MTDDVYLSRITLKRSPEIGPLIRALQPDDAEKAIDMDHRLVWSVMPGDLQAQQEEKRRAGKPESPFLWRRDEARGRYYVLGPKPSAASALFDIETKPFEAALSPRDRLQFVLRVNATVDRRTGGRDGKTERCDVAMDLLKSLPGPDRAASRNSLAEKAARDWLAARARADGFALDALVLDGYRAATVDRGRKKSARFGVFDIRGVVTVTDPAAFLSRLRKGFGRAKAFGCGLMLIRRAD